ncbi:MAG TPA: amidohydrolase family protein [Blastocatellia bacterium]|nr:amidohydrolase family protein [Blastocatellia bacterium]
MRTRLFLMALLSLVLSSLTPNGVAFAAQRGLSRPVAFVEVNVVPLDEERILERQTVIVRDGRIAEIGPATKVIVPKGALRIDAKGKYLLPGLVDMHAHLNSPKELPLYLANGVTTVYNLNGRPAHIKWRDEINRGARVGPVIYTCGPTLRVVKKADEARRLIEEQNKAGYDSIKIYNWVSKEAYDVLIEEAKKRGMLYVGHIPREPGLEGVLKAGQAIAHAEEYVYTFFDNKLDDESRIPQAVRATRDAGVPVIATLVAFDHIIRQAENLPALLATPEMKYLAPWVRDEWGVERNLYRKKFANAEDITYLKKFLALQKKLIKALHESGVRILTGTDAMNMGVVPGFSLHEELRNLVEIGFTPFEAIRAATRYPAEFLARGEFGTVAVGKRADLLLVDGNPLRGINSLSHPAGVMVRGRWLPVGTLWRMLDEVPAAYVDEERFLTNTLEADAEKAIRYVEQSDPFNNLLNAAATDSTAKRGVLWFKKVYQKAKLNNPQSPVVQEAFINALGYRLRDERKKVDAAIEVFKFNINAYPTSANTYDSLAETYLGIGEKKLAAEYYKKALDVNPDYPNAAAVRDLLKKLEADSRRAP